MSRKPLTEDQKKRAYASHQKWRQANKEKIKGYNDKYRSDLEATRTYTRAQTRRWYLKNKYGLAQEEYDNLLTSQGNCCAICKSPSPGKGDWRIDHCHTTRKVRGLLCHKCNVSLGLLGDNPTTIRNMLTYIERQHHV